MEGIRVSPVHLVKVSKVSRKSNTISKKYRKHRGISIPILFKSAGIEYRDTVSVPRSGISPRRNFKLPDLTSSEINGGPYFRE